MIDALEDLWLSTKVRFNPHTIVINANNGPENNSHRSQFMTRVIQFAIKHQVIINLAHYPQYHSNYNPIERVWAVLENHWNGQMLDSVKKLLCLASTMQYNGNNRWSN